MSRPDEYIIKLDRVKNKCLPDLIELYNDAYERGMTNVKVK